MVVVLPVPPPNAPKATIRRMPPAPSRALVRLPLAAVAFLALADTAIVALALPPILLELDTDVAGVAAVLGVYAVVLAVALLPAERVGRAFGIRPLGLAGVALFGRAARWSAGWPTRSGSCWSPAACRPSAEPRCW